MMKRIVTSGVAAAALAASALFALPAAADPPVKAGIATRVGDNTTLFLSIGNDGRDYRPATYSYRGHGHGHGLSPSERMSRDAIRACRTGIQYEARRLGYRDVDFDSRAWAQPAGRHAYRVSFREVEFEGRRHGFDSSVSCTVRDGRVIDIHGIPRAGGGPRYSGYGRPRR